MLQYRYMEEVTKAITWEAPEHHHFEKGSDWFWILGIIAVSAAIAAFFLGNFLFAILILIGAGVMSLITSREPKVIPFAVTTRGVRIGDRLHTYSSLDSYHIEETDPLGPQLLLKSKNIYSPLLVLPLPDEYVDDIEELVGSKLEEEELAEPLLHKIMESLGF